MAREMISLTGVSGKTLLGLSNIFSSNGDYPKAVEANEDECTLCDLCLQGCEVDAIAIHKLYGG